MPMTPFMGVRISCDMFARNWLLSVALRRAWSRASASSASICLRSMTCWWSTRLVSVNCAVRSLTRASRSSCARRTTSSAPLRVRDVRRRADPLAHPAVGLQHGHPARRKMPVRAVGHAQAVLVLVDGPGLQRPAPEVGGVLAVVGMEGVHPAVAAHLLERLPRGGAPLGQVLGHAALGVGQPDDLRAGSHQRAVALLAAQGGLAGALLVVDVGGGAEPLDDLAVFVAHRDRPAQVPAVGAVLTATDAQFRVRARVGLDGGAHAVGRAPPVVGMHRRQPAAVAGILQGHPRVLVEAAVEIVDAAVGPRRPDDLRHAVGGEAVALHGAGEFVLSAAAVLDLAFEGAVGGGEFGGAFAHAALQFVLGGAEFLFDALAFVVLAGEVAVALGELGGAFADGALHAGAGVLHLGLGLGEGVHRLVAPDAGEDQETILEDDPGHVFEPAPVRVQGRRSVDGMRPVHPAQELIEHHHGRRRHQHAPIPVKRQECQRAEDVEMHLGPPAGQVDEQRGKQHLPDGDQVPGDERARTPEDKKQRHGGEHRAEHGRREDLDAHEPDVRDRRVRAVPRRHHDAREPLEREQHGEHPVLATRQGRALRPVEMLAALLDEGGICFHGLARGETIPRPRVSTTEEA